MLWNNVYEFFVMHIFGGFLVNPSNNSVTRYFSYISVIKNDTAEWDFLGNGSITIFGLNMPIGNYLSFIAAIITMVIIVTLCALFIWKIIKLVGGLIR